MNIAAALVVTDIESSQLKSATVTITGGFLAGDALNFANQNGITGSYNAATGVLTLSGTASLAAYQAALDSVTFSSTAADPTSGGADTARTVSFQVNDGVQPSSSLSATVVLLPPPPSLTGSGARGRPITPAARAVNIAAALVVSDIEADQLKGAAVSITSGFLAGDQLNFANQNGITGSYNAATGVLTLTGTASLAAYQAALDSVTFSSTRRRSDQRRHRRFPQHQLQGQRWRPGLQRPERNHRRPAAPSGPRRSGAASTYQAGGAAVDVATAWRSPTLSPAS